MSGIICHHNSRYNIYNTVSDGFRFTRSIDLEQLTRSIKDEEGQSGLDQLPKRLDRAHKNGSSCLLEESLDDFLCTNRAGEKESFLTTDQCIAEFLS